MGRKAKCPRCQGARVWDLRSGKRGDDTPAPVQTYGSGRGQWVHKTVNVLDYLPKTVQARPKRDCGNLDGVLPDQSGRQSELNQPALT